jgi:hypothetical protein
LPAEVGWTHPHQPTRDGAVTRDERHWEEEEVADAMATTEEDAVAVAVAMAVSFSSTLNSIPSNSYFPDYRTIQIETSQIECFLDFVNFAKKCTLTKKALSLLSQVNGNLYNIIPGKKRRGREKQSEIEYIRFHSGAK